MSMREVSTLIAPLFLLLAALAGCQPTRLTPAELAYLNELRRCQHIFFTISGSEADEAWQRAHAWVAKYSLMEIETATDCVIKTYRPTRIRRGYAYSVARVPHNDNGDNTEFQFVVKCFQCGIFDGPLGPDSKASNENRNARMLAHYIKTGEMDPKFLAK